MQRLPWNDLVTVLDKLFVFCKSSPSQNLITPIPFIVKERMSQEPHMGPDLVCTSRLQHTFNQRDITKSLNDLVMRDSMLPDAPIHINHHLPAVFSAATNMTCDRAFIFSHITPNQCNIFPIDGVIKELLCQTRLCQFTFRNQYYARSVFIDPVYQVRFNFRLIFEVPGKGVDQRPAIIPIPRV